MGLTNWLQFLVFAAKYHVSVFLIKNSSLGEFYSLFVVDWVCYMFVFVKGIGHGEVYGLGFSERMFSEV